MSALSWQYRKYSSCATASTSCDDGTGHHQSETRRSSDHEMQLHRSKATLARSYVVQQWTSLEWGCSASGSDLVWSNLI